MLMALTYMCAIDTLLAILCAYLYHELVSGELFNRAIVECQLLFLAIAVLLATAVEALVLCYK